MLGPAELTMLAPDRALPKTVKYGPQAQMAESSLPPGRSSEQLC